MLVPTGSPWDRPIRLHVNRVVGAENDPAIGAPESFTAAMRDVVEAREKALHVSYAAGPYGNTMAYAQQDEKRHSWLPSMPVLHLAVAFCEELHKFPNPDSPYGDPHRDGARLVWNMVQHPQWLAPALVRAEGYRNILADRLPDGCGFNPAKALRLLPQ